MYARLDYCSTEHGELPAAVVCFRRSDYYEGDADALILAHKEDDGDLRGLDFICPDEEEAFRRLREIVQQRYDRVTIDEQRNRLAI